MNKNVVKIIFHNNGSATLCVNGGAYTMTYHNMEACAFHAMEAREKGVDGWESDLQLADFEIMREDVEHDLTDFFYAMPDSHLFNVRLFAREITKLVYPD